MADARTTVTLRHLRDLERKAGKRVPITSEILDIQNRELARVAEADDFIVSNTRGSLTVAQVSEHRHLVEVFDELFTPGGCERYLKPATDDVQPGTSVRARLRSRAAPRRDRDRLSIGDADAGCDASFGIVVNSPERAAVKRAAGDCVIVAAR